MDPSMIPSMIFTVVMVTIVGGFILLLPLTRQLGRLLRSRIQQGDMGARDREIEGLRTAVEALRDEVERLADRQDFTERLLERPRTTDEKAG
jgi:hypothetical protein